MQKRHYLIRIQRGSQTRWLLRKLTNLRLDLLETNGWKVTFSQPCGVVAEIVGDGVSGAR